MFTFSEQTLIPPPLQLNLLFNPFWPTQLGFYRPFLSFGLSGCTLNRQDVRLTLHYEKGFTVTRELADLTGGAVLYRYPYEKLKMSADDGIRNLYLDFGGPEGEMVSLAVMSERLPAPHTKTWHQIRGVTQTHSLDLLMKEVIWPLGIHNIKWIQVRPLSFLQDISWGWVFFF